MPQIIIPALIKAAISIGISLVAKALTKKPKAQTQSFNAEQTGQRRLQAGQPLEILVGERIVGGVAAFDDVYGTNNEYWLQVTILSAKPCTSFEKLFLDGEEMTLSGDPTAGEVEVTSHFLGKASARRVKCRVFLGGDNSGLGAYLNGKMSSKFAATDNFGDYCVAVLECRNTNDDLDQATGENLIPFQGFPEAKYRMKGAKVCVLTSSGVYGNEATYIYSANAGWIDGQFDYGWYSGTGDGRALIVGNGYDTAFMDTDQIESNASYCDTHGFTCAGILRSGVNNDQEEIWKCFNADRYESPSKVRTIPAGNRAFGETIDLSLYPAAMVTAYDEHGYSTEVYNGVRTSYAEPAEHFGEKDLPVYSKSEWIADDNHIPREMDLPLLFVTDKVAAAKLEKQEVYASRYPATCTVSDLPPGFMRVELGTLVTLVNADVPAVNSRTWIVEGRGESNRLDITLSLREYAGTDAYDFDEPTETPVVPIVTPPTRSWGDWFTPAPYVSPSAVASIEADLTTAQSDLLSLDARVEDLEP